MGSGGEEKRSSTFAVSGYGGVGCIVLSISGYPN